MVDDTYYITPHEAALAVVATAMKKSRLPLHILVINSILAGFFFTSGSMLYIVCESTGVRMQDNGFDLFVVLAQGLVYGVGLFYVVICGMELFNSNILYFSVGVMRGAVTIMDLFISWFVSFWLNLASTIFVMYLFCHVSKVFQQPDYIAGTIAIGLSKDSYSFMETFLKGIIGNFFVCLAIYLQIMVKPLHVKLLMMVLPVFTFVSCGFTHVVADMGLVPAAIFNNVGYGFGHYFWKIMLPGALGNMIGGSFFGIVIPWYLHLVVIEQDMKKLNLPAYEEKDEQPNLNMDSRVVRVPVADSTSDSSIMEFKPDGLQRVQSRAASIATGMSARSHHSSSRIRSPRGVFPVAGMGPPLNRERTIASSYQPASMVDDILDPEENDEEEEDETGLNDEEDINTDSENLRAFDEEGNIINPYDPEKDKMGDKLMKAITRTVTRVPPEKDLEKAQTKDKAKRKGASFNTQLIRQFTYGGGGNDKKEIRRRLSNAKITRKAAALSNDIAGIHQMTVDHSTHTKRRDSVQSNLSKNTNNSSRHELSENDKQKIGIKYANDRWKHMVYDYELDGEMPVSYISDQSSKHGPLSNVEEEFDPLENENPQSDTDSDSAVGADELSGDNVAADNYGVCDDIDSNSIPAKYDGLKN